MAGPENEIVEVVVVSGESPRPAMVFRPGTPANPVSVGASAEWRVLAPGVGPVHLFLAFDGQTVHVAGASPPTLPTLLAGSPVGTAWVRANLPCEVRFGAAALSLRRAAARGGDAKTSHPPSTVHDGGALYHAAQRAVQVALQVKQSGAPGAGPGGPPGGFGGTALLPNAPRVQGPAPTAEALPNTARIPGASPAGGPAPAPPHLSAPSAQFHPPPVQGPAPAPAPAAGTATPPVDTDKEEPKGFWQSASAVKKATLILMPFAVIASYFMLQPEAPGPAPRVVNSAGSAAAKRTVPDGGASLPAANFANPELVVGAATEAGVQGAGAAAIAADSRGARVDAGTAKIAPLTAGKKTPEREALDTAAAGSFDDAARRYDTLAAAHPGEPSYKEAARILRDKASRPH